MPTKKQATSIRPNPNQTVDGVEGVLVRAGARCVHVNEGEAGDSCMPPLPPPSALCSPARYQRPPRTNNNWHRARRTSTDATGQRDRKTDTQRELRPGWGLIPSPLARPPPPSLPPSLLIRSPFPFIECQIMFGWSDLVPKSSGGAAPRRPRTAAAVFCRFQLASRFGAMASSRRARVCARKEGRKEGSEDRRKMGIRPLLTCGAKFDKNMTTNVE